MNSKFIDICLDEIKKVVFFKRDELNTDLVCCELDIRTKNGLQIWFSHEEAPGLDNLLSQLEKPSGFDLGLEKESYFASL